MWGQYPPGHTPSTLMAQKFIQPHLFYNDFHTEFADLAEYIGDQIATELQAGRITPTTVAVLLQDFGMDSDNCDEAQGDNAFEPY